MGYQWYLNGSEISGATSSTLSITRPDPGLDKVYCAVSHPTAQPGIVTTTEANLDVASARTFGFEKDVQKLRENGFALGGSLENAVVVGDDNILNKGGLRFEDEFVRHKILDSIGDLYLAGYPVQGYFSGKKSGHYLNNQLLSKLLSDHTNFEII